MESLVGKVIVLIIGFVLFVYVFDVVVEEWKRRGKKVLLFWESDFCDRRKGPFKKHSVEYRDGDNI